MFIYDDVFVSQGSAKLQAKFILRDTMGPTVGSLYMSHVINKLRFAYVVVNGVKSDFFLFTQYLKRDTRLADNIFYLMALCNKTLYIYTS